MTVFWAARPRAPPATAALHQGLKDTGVDQGRQSMEWRCRSIQPVALAGGRLVSRGAAVIVASMPTSVAGRRSWKNHPDRIRDQAIVEHLLVDSFSRPGGNLTGVSVLISIRGPKRL